MSINLRSTFPTLPKTERGKPIVINGDPKGKNFLYCNGNSVIIRNIEDPTQVDIYTQHAAQTTVAKYSPSGFYIASGDVTGKIRIWDTTQKEHILKNEFQPIAGAIKDIAWTSDSQRICAVGEGKERFGHVFNADTGTSTGELLGQSKSVNNCDFRPSRPFRLATASEDNTVAFYEGPPFKFKKTLNELTRFANCVRYAPNGENFISAGADGKAFVYDGKTGDLVRELGSPAHKGGIYAICYSPDSSQILTVSGDKTAKIFDVESGEMVQEFPMGTKIEDMQVGCLWQGEHLLTVSLSGHINYLNRNDPSTPLRILRGHNKQITALAVSEDKTSAFTGASDGKICVWDIAGGNCEVMQGSGHSNQVQDLKLVGDLLYSVAMDDCLIVSNASSKQYGSSVKLPSQPRRLDASANGLCVVACINHIAVVRNGSIVQTLPVSWEPTSAAINATQTQVAIGGSNSVVHLYDVTSAGDNLAAQQQLTQPGAISDVSFSRDGRYLAAADSCRNIYVYTLPELTTLVTSHWAVHTARVNSVEWSPDSSHLCSAGLDCALAVLDPTKITAYNKCPGAHLMTNITRCRWLDDQTLVSAAFDGVMKIWDVVHK